MTAKLGARGAATGSILPLAFAIPQTAIASLLPDDLLLL